MTVDPDLQNSPNEPPNWLVYLAATLFVVVVVGILAMMIYVLTGGLNA